MLVPIVVMARFFDPLRPLKKWADRQRRRDASLHNNRKPHMTPEEARRDHRDMLWFMAVNALGGMVIGFGVGLTIILLDVGGLMGLMRRAAHPVLPVILVVFPFVSLFGAGAVATAILTMPYETKFRDEGGEPPPES